MLWGGWGGGGITPVAEHVLCMQKDPAGLEKEVLPAEADSSGSEGPMI